MQRIMIPLFLVLALMFGGFKYWVYLATSETVTVQVTDKTVKRYDGGDKYLIFTDAETFENVDTWMALKFNSSDVYGKIRPGATCDLRVYGFRVPYLSWYRNIVTASCQ